MRSGDSATVVALVGTPNSGKTTLFNWLTGSSFRAVNYPGTTVDAFIGKTLDVYGEPVGIVDTPGTYSLFAKSPDEEVTTDVLFQNKLGKTIAGVVVCVDGTQLDRQLYLVQQIRESGYPFVVALTMMDLIEESNWGVQVEALSRILEAPVVPIHGRLGGGVKELVTAMRDHFKSPSKNLKPLQHWDMKQIEARAKEASATVRSVVTKDQRPLQAQVRTGAFDRWLLHPVLGLIVFAGVMFALFSSIFWLAAPLMDLVDFAFAQMGSWTHELLGDGMLTDFLADGLIAAFGAVLVFVPQILVLFLGLSILEDSGYLARAATLIDRPLSALGLSGRSFVPLLSGYACAVPAIMAARSIRSRRERWLAVFVIPLMSCSARLPVYALLLTFLYPAGPAWKPGLALAIIYLGSIVVGGVAASILNRVVKLKRDSVFMLELPYYRMPQYKVVFRTALLRTKGYVYRAGPVIFTLALILWLGTNFPRSIEEGPASQAVANSYIGQLGQAMEPVFEPMGVDWRVGVGLISAFAAREVFVSAMALVFDISTEDEDSIQEGLLEKMSVAVTPSGEAVFNTASVIGLIVFFMIALQCTSTTAIAGKEMGSWRFALIQLVTLNVVAYVFAVGLFQFLSRMGFAA